ncbi:MAG: MAPEG family protein [Rhodobacteraceae bacterium]|nr:MAPEG family protein [Paracoccaceae bacterium]
MDHFAQYSHAIAAVLIYALIAQILNAATGIRKGNDNLAPGASQPQDYDNAGYRLDRTYMNSVEVLSFYAAIVFAAILAGASPFWINLLASAALVFRICANVVYLRGIGKGYGGIRTVFLVLISLCNLGMVAFALIAVFGG